MGDRDWVPYQSPVSAIRPSTHPSSKLPTAQCVCSTELVTQIAARPAPTSGARPGLPPCAARLSPLPAQTTRPAVSLGPCETCRVLSSTPLPPSSEFLLHFVIKNEILVGMKNDAAAVENTLALPPKVKQQVTVCPAIPHLGVPPQELETGVQTNACTRMFTGPPFARAKWWK